MQGTKFKQRRRVSISNCLKLIGIVEGGLIKEEQKLDNNIWILQKGNLLSQIGVHNRTGAHEERLFCHISLILLEKTFSIHDIYHIHMP